MWTTLLLTNMAAMNTTIELRDTKVQWGCKDRAAWYLGEHTLWNLQLATIIVDSWNS